MVAVALARVNWTGRPKMTRVKTPHNRSKRHIRYGTGQPTIGPFRTTSDVDFQRSNQRRVTSGILVLVESLVLTCRAGCRLSAIGTRTAYQDINSFS